MRYCLLTINLLFLCQVFSCTGDLNHSTEPGDEAKNNLIVYLKGDYASGILSDSGWVPFEESKFRISGQIIAEQIVIPENIQFGDSIYDDSNIDFSINLGSVSFQKFIDHFDEHVNYIELKTSLGSISGEMVIPGNIHDISFSTSSITYNHEFTVSWQCDYATSYEVTYSIEIDQFPGYALREVTTITDTKINILLGHDYYSNKYFRIEIQPLNIPIFEVGSPGNMEGDGSGFISCYGITSTARKFVY